MGTHKWLTPKAFIELKRAYVGGMMYKEMAHKFHMTINQVSWYLRDQPKRQTRSVKPMDKIIRSRVNASAMKHIHQQAKKELKQEIEQAKKEQATAPLYRPSRDKVW